MARREEEGPAMKFFIEHPVATTMLFVMLMVIGVYSFINTPLELAPQEDFPQVEVSAVWPGVSPEIIQTDVTSVLEEALFRVQGLTKMSSSTSMGSAAVTVEFAPRTDMEFAMLSVREELARTRALLPAGVRPVVTPYVPEGFRVQTFMHYTISGDYPLQKLREMVKDRLELGLGAVKGVSSVTVGGGSEREIRVLLDEEKLKIYGLHPYQVSSAVEDRLRVYKTGYVRKGGREYLFKFKDELTGLADIRATVVGYAGHTPVRVRDVADVTVGYGEIYYINRINGRSTVSLDITKEKGTNTLQVSGEVKRRLERIKAELPPGLSFRMINDESREIVRNLRDLARLAVIIIVVVFIMIFIVLRRPAPSLLILSSIGVSLFFTFILIYFFHIPMNMLTLGALALGIGMFVDNAIVVFDAILRKREAGFSPAQAAELGPKEVFTAVLASTLTTMVVFFAFPYFQGRLKIYYLPLGIVICSALAASLLVSFSLIPALSPRFLKKAGRRKEGRTGRLFDGVLKLAIKCPLEVLLIVGLLIFGSYKWFRKEVVIGRFYPSWYSKQYLSVSVGMPQGTEISRTDEVIRKFEDRAAASGVPCETEARISADRGYLQISFQPEIEYSYKPYALKEELISFATQFAGLDVSVMGFDPQGYFSSMGTGVWYSSRIKIFGYNLKKLRDISADLEKTVKRNPRVKEVRRTTNRYSWSSGDSFEDILKLDRQAMLRYDIDPQYLYAHIGSLIRGRLGAADRVIMEGGQMDISFKFPEAAVMDARGLQDALIQTRSGQFLRLGGISTLEERPLAGSIDREDQKFQMTVMWEFRGPAKAEERYRDAVFTSLRLPPGFSATKEDSWMMTSEEFSQVTFAIVVALLLIYMVVAALYESFVQPLIIFCAIPLSLIGVFAAFVIAKFNFDSSAYIGVILLSGIVVNNSILVVDHINLKRRQGLPLMEAMVIGARDRVRPIMMTSAATVFGILPMLLIPGEAGIKREIWSSLALCTVGGMSVSALLIPIVVPVIYYQAVKLPERFRAATGQKRSPGGTAQAIPPDRSNDHSPD